MYLCCPWQSKMACCYRTLDGISLMKIFLVPLLVSLASVVAAAELKPQPSAYLQAVAGAPWSVARPLQVSNQGAVDDTLAVVVPVTGFPQRTFVVVDESGLPLVTQNDDLNGDGTVDEVCTLLKLKSGQQRTVTLLGSDQPLPAAPADLVQTEQLAGSWAPMRMQPSRSPGNTQMSYYRSPANSGLARKLIARLEQRVPMELVECPDFRLLVGHRSGLIEAMRPASLPDGMLGSYLREFVPNDPEMGPMTRRFSGPVRCRLEWGTANRLRQVTIYRNGLIKTSWAAAPPTVQVITCSYPYRFLQAGSENAVRFSQMLQKRRPLPGVDTAIFFGRNHASLHVSGEGLKAVEHQVWLDSGEIAWEAGTDYSTKKSSEPPVERITRWTADTYIGGGLHVTSWQNKGTAAALSYRIGNFGAHAAGQAPGLVRATAGPPASVVPPLGQPATKGGVTVAFDTVTKTVNRLHPNKINGWELRPVTLAQRNPQAAYFQAELANHSEQEEVVEVTLDDAAWIHEASLLSRREMLKNQKFPAATVPYFHDEAELVPGGTAVRIAVPAGKVMPVEICIRPKPDSLGPVTCRVRTGPNTSTQLNVLVKPTILFMPKSSGMAGVSRELSNVEYPAGAPFSYGARFWGGYTPELTQWYKAAHRDAERSGFWTVDPLGMRHLATVHGEATAKGQPGVDLDAWIDKVLKALREPDGADYRVRIYPHDEIWEVLGRQGHYVVPVPWMVNADRQLVMNSPNATWSSFQEPAMNPPFEYHLKLPNDIAELFYYCGRDPRLQSYAHRLIDPRRELFAQWQADPALMAAAGTDSPRQIFSFWISTQLHVANYASVRRQIWWLRHHGIDSFNSWACYGWYGTAQVMHWMLMQIQSENAPNGRGTILTDRALGWIDMKEDMELVTLVRLLTEQLQEETTRQELRETARLAYEASQREEFDLARHHYITALKKLRPDLLPLAPRDLYRGPVAAEELSDLFADDIDFHEARRIPRTRVSLLKQRGRRPKPTVDGTLDNAYLEQGAYLQMRENREGHKAQTATGVYMVRDDKDLYLFFDCHEPKMKNLRMALSEPDSGIWADDCIEVLLDREGNQDRYAHFILNAANVRYDSRSDMGTKWNPQYETAVLRDNESWSAELKIPFEALGGPPQKGETWRMNFYRVRKTSGTEVNAWSATFGSVVSPGRFGFVQFK